eukprot:CAMPEP_0178398238 /NCGR_PEP_ID=MMETSP0689_2-20121128/14669_1 /TAXON_ID=160604 /ORGANISM="Amphidinium massartii, Strain CS-259" /LENGTH=130 /DNA_ID=CAMNT_0020018993 /DNA_START=116 /DNA_END=508 /DNA_ORIENTATION=-
MAKSMVPASVVAAVLLLNMCLPVATESYVWFSCWSGDCGAFEKRKEENWAGDICCAESSDDCCESDPGAQAGAGIGLIVLIVVITLISCGCCGCCPLYNLLPCSKCNVGCCVPPKTGGAQPPVVVGNPVA